MKKILLSFLSVYILNLYSMRSNNINNTADHKKLMLCGAVLGSLCVSAFYTLYNIQKNSHYNTINISEIAKKLWHNNKFCSELVFNKINGGILLTAYVGYNKITTDALCDAISADCLRKIEILEKNLGVWQDQNNQEAINKHNVLIRQCQLIKKVNDEHNTKMNNDRIELQEKLDIAVNLMNKKYVGRENFLNALINENNKLWADQKKFNDLCTSLDTFEKSMRAFDDKIKQIEDNQKNFLNKISLKDGSSMISSDSHLITDKLEKLMHEFNLCKTELESLTGIANNDVGCVVKILNGEYKGLSVEGGRSEAELMKAGGSTEVACEALKGGVEENKLSQYRRVKEFINQINELEEVKNQNSVDLNSTEGFDPNVFDIELKEENII